ncbi:ComF family protein [Anabaena sp. UHCC 0204]|uniref:ComF family protein n=1 Tax=Anabaena sp. UHCC 0204 TaxID=2590009 RepID=UPI001445FAE9|nr:ComF family protein [Anabaena sp. UHCC 0204]MTJ10612.1 ComF family protein [Anabaena sp. UHCC 0204]
MKIFQNLLNLFLKSHCPLCQRPTPRELCPYCTKQIQSCQKQNPSYLWKQPLPVFVWGSYGGAVKRAIAALKYENQPQIGYVFGQWLGESWLLNSPQAQQKLLVVPIPMHPKKQKQRGFNQAALIAEGFCNITGYKLKVNGLERIKETEALFSLSPAERQENLVDAFVIGKDLRRRPNIPILLVDDIYTTGATVKVAVKTLTAHEIKVLGVAAVATTNKEI